MRYHIVEEKDGRKEGLAWFDVSEGTRTVTFRDTGITISEWVDENRFCVRSFLVGVLSVTVVSWALVVGGALHQLLLQ